MIVKMTDTSMVIGLIGSEDEEDADLDDDIDSRYDVAEAGDHGAPENADDEHSETGESTDEETNVFQGKDIVDIIERKKLHWYCHVKRMQEERLPKLIMEWIPGERRERGRPRKTWMECVRAAMKTRHLEADQWLNRKEWCLGYGRRRQQSQDRKDR
jgi:hypothetical protein